MTIEEIVTKYSPMLYRICVVMLGNETDAQDAVQDTICKYLEHRKGFRDEEHEKAWLIRVTLNACHKVWRSSFYRRRSEMPDLEQLLAQEDQETGERSPEETFLDKERARAVLEAVWKLPVTYRDVIHLFYYEELSVKEIAMILDRKVSTVTSQLTRGREILKKNLREEYDFA